MGAGQHRKGSTTRHVIICVFLAMAAAAGCYKAFSLYVINQAEKNIQNLLLSHKGIHHYIQRVMLPAMQQYKKDGKLPEAFYAPELFSSSYIVRIQHQFYNEERRHAGFPELYYKLAAKNPRNPVNKADAEEEALIERFNRDRSLSKVKEVVDIQGHKFLTLAIPFLRNETHCLVCHGTRQDAPQELQDRYPGEGGFNEKVGDIRAITSIRAPLHDEYRTLSTVLAALAIGALSFLYLVQFNSRLARKVAEGTALLRENERKLRSFLESTSSTPWELDLPSGRFTLMGPQIEKLLGYPAASWQDIATWKSRLHPEDREWASAFCAAETAKGQDHDLTYRALHCDGSYRWVRDVISVVEGEHGPERLVGFMQDVTVQKKLEVEKAALESRLSQAQKMEAIGTLAGGIAHDFNNILSVILGFADLAKDDAPADSNLSKDLDRVISAGHRAKELVKQILAFSRQTQIERVTLAPQSILKEAVKMLRASIPSTITIIDHIAADCGTLEADPTQLHQILMNLCTNAYHAMEESGGTLTIELKTAEQLPHDFAALYQRQASDFMELSVSDTGCGISPLVMDKIFEPFFTTKEVGRGTGMGLAITYGIVHDYGGTISVDSELGKGTAFHLFLPKGRQEVAAVAPVRESTPRGRGERILFVDDEEFLCEMGRNMLSQLGYVVVARQRSIDALEEFLNHPQEYDLVITDQTMPDLTGMELASRILQARPDMPIILCTGFSSQVSAAMAKANGIREFVFKPVDRDILAQLIRTVLTGPKPSDR